MPEALGNVRIRSTFLPYFYYLKYKNIIHINKNGHPRPIEQLEIKLFSCPLTSQFLGATFFFFYCVCCFRFLLVTFTTVNNILTLFYLIYLC